MQAYYSLVGRDLEWEIIPATKDLGLGTMIWSPLAAGYLSGKYTGDDAESGRRSAMDFPPVDKQQGAEVIAVLREIGEAHGGASPSRVAISWLLHQTGVTSVIIGARKQEQLEDNLEAMDLKLSDDELKRLDEVSARFPAYPGWMPDMKRGQDFGAALDHSKNMS